MKKAKHTPLLRRVLALCLVFVLVCGSLAPVHAHQSSTVRIEQTDAEPLTGRNPGQQVGEKENAAPYGEAETVRVSIVLEDKSTIAAGFSTQNIASNATAMAYRAGLEREQQALTTRISRKLGSELDVVWNLTLAANIISANVAYGDIEKIKSVEGVADVFLETRYEATGVEAAEPNTAVSTGMTGAYQAWNSGYTGAGSRIAIIDSGLDTTHQSFDNGAFLYALSESGKEYDLLDTQEIEGLLPQLHAAASAAELTISDKIPFGYNYVDGNTNVSHLYDLTGGHGSHVAGIAAANRYIPDGDGYANALDAVMVAGSAPDAQVLVMKVFGENGGAWDSDFMAALEDAIVLGCDSVNLSLGTSSAGMTTAYDYEQIMQMLESTDTVVVISAGNNGSWPERTGTGYLYAEDVSFQTGGSPGTHTNGLTVASVENQGAVAELFRVGEELFPFSETLYRNVALRSLAANGDVTLEYIFVDGVGQDSDYSGIDLGGKVVFCSRGQTSFVEKANLAVSRGAAAVVIYNGVDGTFDMDLTDYAYTIPVVSILKDDANAIRALSTYETSASGTGYYTGSLTILKNLDVKENDSAYYTMSSFSSWGVPGDLSIKPEITAPGGNVYSVSGTHLTSSGNAGGSDQYEWMSGTSMAAPQVTGLIAQLMQYIEENGLSQEGLTDRALAQSLLMSTASPIYAAYTDSSTSGYLVSVMQQGAGLANVSDAMGAATYVLMGDDATDSATDGKVKAELGDDPDKTGIYSFTFTLNNLTDRTQSYTLSSDVFRQNQFRAYPNKVSSDGSLVSSSSSTVFMDTTTRELEAEAVFTVDGEPVAAPENLDAYDFDGDGDTDKADAQLLMDHVVQGSALTSGRDQTDVDGDGDTDVHDAQDLLSRLSGGIVTVPADGSVTVEVTIALSELDKREIGLYFENGTYIEAYIYANSVADAEGAVSSRHSIPVLAYYGGWTDASMFDQGSWEEYFHGLETKIPYTYSYNGIDTNSFSMMYLGDSGEYYFCGNPILDDAEYLEERNALNNEDSYLYRVYYALIRNAAALRVTITDVQTGEVYFHKDYGEGYAAYYDPGSDSWENTNDYAILNWQGRDQEGNLLPNGTAVRVELTAAPEYYVKDDGAIDWDALGEGATYSTMVTIDTSAPTVVGAEEKIRLESGSALKLTVHDNRHVAAVMLYDSTNELVDTVNPGQTEAGVQTEVTLGRNLADGVYTLEVADYAENISTYRVFLGTEETAGVESVTVEPSNVFLLAGESQTLTANVSPNTLTDRTVTWTSSDESVATVTANGTVTAVGAGEATITAASNLDPNVMGSCTVSVVDPNTDLNAVVWDDEGIWFSEFNTAELPDLTHLTASTDHQINAVSMAPDGTMYASTMYLGAGYGEIYRVDPVTYEMTLVTNNSNWGGWPGYFTDMTYVPGLYGTGGLIGIYGSWVCSVNLQTGASEWIDTFGENLIGITTISGSYDAASGMSTDFVYLIGTSGTVYQEGYIWRNGSGISTYSGSMGKARESFATGLDTGGAWYYNSAYYDGNYLYWSNLNFPYSTSSGTVTLYAIDADDTKEVYTLGQFAPGVLPVAGLYQSSGVPYSSALAEEKMAEINRKLAGNGGLNSVSADPTPVATAEDQMVLEVTARDENGEVAATDGLITVAYDPATTILTDIQVHGELKSLVFEDGAVTFGYANTDALAAGDSVATLVFDMADRTEFRATVTHRQVNNIHLESVTETVAHTFTALVTEPTCTEGGFTTYICEHCGYSYVGDYTEALGHSFTEYVSDNNATCTEDGTKTAKCDRCDATETVTDEDSARGHAYGDWTVDSEPTYLTEGVEIRTCGVCGASETRAIAPLGNPFEDVPNGSWYFDPVMWAVENGITTGTSPTTFSPDNECQRAQVVTFLWRTAGSPEPTTTVNPFEDVNEKDFYYQAVLWAVENGITNGIDSTHFGPYGYCNRAQVVTFLWRAKGQPAPGAEVHPFTDVQEGSFYYDAMLWAVEKGVTTGMTPTTFGPGLTCNRAQIVTFLYRVFA